MILKQGSRGKAVQALQHDLNALGWFAPLLEDGKYGARTKATVASFQDLKFLKIDGEATPATRRYLTSTLERNAQAQEANAD